MKNKDQILDKAKVNYSYLENELKRSQKMFTSLLDSINVIVYVTDIKTNELLYINKYSKDIFGDVVGKLCWQALHTGQSGPCDFCTNDKLLTPEGKPNGVSRLEFKNTVNGSWYDIHDRTIEWIDGRIARLKIGTDITERNKTEQDLLYIAKGVSEVIGEKFFASLVQHISEILEVDYAYIAEIVPDKSGYAKTLSFYVNGNIIDNMEVNISGTPCEKVSQNGHFSCPAEVQKHFPAALIMAGMNVESYFGIRLSDSSGVPIGLLSVMCRKRVRNIKRVESVLMIFGVRAAAELERLHAEKTLNIMSLTDELTGINNRRGFFSLAEQQLKQSIRDKKGIYLIVADIDHLKKINDDLGHHEGDVVLIKTANILKESFRRSDVVARIGGDEFVILVNETPETTIDTLTVRLKENIKAYNKTKSKNYELSLSIGVIRCGPEEPCNLEKLIMEADTLMYQQKRKKQEPK